MDELPGVQDRPDLDDLLATVADFLGEARARLDGEARYHAIVCAHLVGICRRELEARGVTAPDAGARRRWCDAARAGVWDDRLDDAVALALDDVIAKVAVVSPDHLAPDHLAPDHHEHRRSTERPPGGTP